jgi:hypothetical protein
MSDDFFPSKGKMAGIGCLAVLAYLLFWAVLLAGACLIVKAVFFS